MVRQTIPTIPARLEAKKVKASAQQKPIAESIRLPEELKKGIKASVVPLILSGSRNKFLRRADHLNLPMTLASRFWEEQDKVTTIITSTHSLNHDRRFLLVTELKARDPEMSYLLLCAFAIRYGMLNGLQSKEHLKPFRYLRKIAKEQGLHHVLV